MRNWLFHALAAICQVALPIAAFADDPAEQVVAIFERRCVSCHNAHDKKGGLSLATLAQLRAGGESGPVVVANKPAESLMLDYVMGEKPAMPKSGPPLAAEEVAAIKTWIAASATWPEQLVLKDRSLPSADWWSLKPLTQPMPPAIDRAKYEIENPIDAFIVVKLVEKGLPQSPLADRRTLIRRLYFDLIGLPPAPAEVDAFVADADPQAYAKLVDRLLESPHYGERWARHWLDVVHYGETHGYDKDKPRTNAWPYRDYVIRAFNSDKPYGRFVEEQVAGDVLYPGTADGVEAMGFIAAGPWDFIGHAEVPENKIDGKVARHLDRDDMVATTIGTFCSLTVGCAQCHNHKFDPIPQADYYKLQAIFAALDRADKPYDRDPQIARQRARLQGELARQSAEKQAFDADLVKRGGAKLAKLDARIAELSKDKSGQERPEFGYHSAIETKADVAKWVQVDLGSTQEIAKIEFVGCHDEFNGMGAGFGFPVRFKVEIAGDAAFEQGVTTVLDRTQADVANPGVTLETIDLSGAKGRYVRFTATKLGPRLATDFIFALAELMVIAPDGKNLAAGAVVTSLDSIEAPVRWRRTNLVDGYYFGKASGAEKKNAEARAQREDLLAKLLDADGKRQMDERTAAIAKVEQSLQALPAPQLVYAGTAYTGSGAFAGTGGKPRPIFILNRGNVTQPGEEVSPGALSCIGLDFGVQPNAPGPGLVPVKEVAEGDRRAALARWLSAPRHPLTWRSIVNRVWQYHFGRGIVDTPNDFGRMGALPSHPELLDWLAVEFRDNGQSLKRLHKLMVLSHTYRQESRILDFGLPILGSGEVGAELSNPKSKIQNPKSVDVDNRFLWRANRRRLEAEAVRDAVLFVSGKLDPAPGGPSFQDFVIDQPAHSPHYEYHLHDPDDPRSHRRSIYRFLVRSQPQPFMATLDCADPSLRVDKRNESLSALQALALLNNGFMVTMSRHFAERVEREARSARVSDPADAEGQVRIIVRHALNREPSDAERAALAEYIRQHGLASACRVVLNLNEFAFVD